MIITNNEDALRIKCQDVLPEEVGELIAVLEAELNNANRLGMSGIGLAAPQIGIGKNIAIIRIGNGLDLNLVNPKIVHGYDPTMFRSEGCLSFPGRTEDTTRFQEVHVVNNLVAPQSFVATGLLAVCIQHETDHFNSILFMDHALTKSSIVFRVGRNDLCPCGSNRKFKKCCG